MKTTDKCNDLLSTSFEGKHYCAKTCGLCSDKKNIAQYVSYDQKKQKLKALRLNEVQCINHQCQNGATCYPINTFQYGCKCRGGYTGQFCENIRAKQAECGGECQNSGFCVSNTCICMSKLKI
jgi:hypothetical protein